MPLATATPGVRPRRSLSSRVVRWGGGFMLRTDSGLSWEGWWSQSLKGTWENRFFAKGTFPRWKSSRQEVTDGKHLRPGTLCELNWVPSKQRVVVLTLRTSECDVVCKQVLGRREEVRGCHAGPGGLSSKYPGPVMTEVWGDTYTS